MVSRWGHILVRRALASRMDTPVGMNGADWAALRAGLLLRMGEADAARAMVQSVDSGFFTPGLEDAAMGAFLATADPVGLCPITALTAAGRQGANWDLARAICSALPAMVRRPWPSSTGCCGGAGLTRSISCWRRSWPGPRRHAARGQYRMEGCRPAHPVAHRPGLCRGDRAAAGCASRPGPTMPFWPSAPDAAAASRCAAADVAAGRGILSSAAMVDLYSQLAEINAQDGADQDKTWGPLADKLRTAYTAPEASDRLAAIKTLWGNADDPDRAYSRLVLTAYAAARMVPSPDLAGDAGGLIASMLTAGLDANAARWSGVVAVGSEPWGLIALSAPAKATAIGNDALDTFQSGDDSSGALRSQFLLAGLMGLGRIDGNTANAFAGKLKVDMNRQTRWTRAIDDAAESNNPALVALLAGFGMQAQSWDKMTAVHLYHIVSALRRVGLDGEARMIAAEAVARV
jgi:hypothetical protein